MNLQAATSRAALDKIRHGQAWEDRAAKAGERLRTVLPAFSRIIGRSGPYALQVGTTVYEDTDLGSVALWKALKDGTDDIRLTVRDYSVLSLTAEDVLRLTGPVAQIAPLAAADEQQLKRASDQALALRDFVASASMADALNRQDLTMPHKGGQASLATVIADDVSRVALDLLAAGHIDENFTLYCSDYHDVAISVSAMNFILHCVQHGKHDYRFRLDSTSVRSVEAEMSTRFLTGESVFNIDVFDHYLRTDSSKIAGAVRRLATPADPRTDFIDVYLKDGAEPAQLIAALMPSWAQAFVSLAHSEVLELDAQTALVSTALRGASAEVDYETDETVIRLISEQYREVTALVDDLGSDEADTLARVLQNLTVTIDDLRPLGREQRRAIAERGLFPVTPANIASAAESDHVPPLDDIRDSRPLVYQYLLKHADDYVAALGSGDHSVKDADNFVSVLNDLAAAQPTSVKAVAERAAPDCIVGDIAEIQEAARTGVVCAGRLELSVANVQTLTATGVVDDDLAALLRDHDLTYAGAATTEQRAELAMLMINTSALSTADRVRHAKGLLADDTVELEAIESTGLDAVPALVEAQLLNDGPETYERLQTLDYATREAFLAVSPNLHTFVTSLPLSADDLGQLIQSSRISREAKKAVAFDGDFLAAHVDKASATKIARWASSTGEINISGLVALARAGAPAESVLELLTPHLAQIQQDDLDTLLNALGDDYAGLTHLGRHRPKLPDLAGTEELLVELKARDLVSTYKKEASLLSAPKWKINMRLSS